MAKKDVECFNCHKKGHFSCDCRGPGGAKEGQPLPKKHSSKSKDNTTNAVTNIQDSAWSAVVLGLGMTDSLFDDVYLDEMSLKDIISDNDELPLPALENIVSDNDEPPAPELEASALPAFTVSTAIDHTSELYDSGATCHMTPHKGALLNYTPIAPKPISTANQLTFHTFGHGGLPIHLPNGNNFTNITLRDVLYTLDIALTLVSIGLIDKAGYTVTFKGSMCTIRDTASKFIGSFPKQDGLYCVDTHLEAPVSTHSATVKMSATEAHHRLGHISPEAAKQLC